MRYLYIFLFAFFCSSNAECQDLKDCKDFIKEKVERMPGLDNYVNTIAYTNSIVKQHVETFAGRPISDEEYKNILIIGYEVYLSNDKSQLLFEVINCIDLRGIYKVSTSKSKSSQGDEYYVINIYVAENYLSTEYVKTENVKRKDSPFLMVKADLETIQKIKKAVIKLALLSGAKSVKDGDDLFKD